MDRPLELSPPPIAEQPELITVKKARKLFNALFGQSSTLQLREKTPSSSSPTFRPLLLSHRADDCSLSPYQSEKTEKHGSNTEQRAGPQGPERRWSRSPSPNYYAPAKSSPLRSPPLLPPASMQHSSPRSTEVGLGLGLGVMPMMGPSADIQGYSLAEGGFLRRFLCCGEMTD